MTNNNWVSMGCLWAVCRLSVSCLWQTTGCLWPVCRLSVSCLWQTTGCLWGCLWPIYRVSVGCLWVVCDRQLGPNLETPYIPQTKSIYAEYRTLDHAVILVTLTLYFEHEMFQSRFAFSRVSDFSHVLCILNTEYFNVTLRSPVSVDTTQWF